MGNARILGFVVEILVLWGNGLVGVVLLVWICRIGLGTFKRCQPNWFVDDSGVHRIGQVNAKGVEACFELGGVLGMDGVEVGWALVKRKLRVLVLVEYFRVDGMIW
jgi:hypothetical protein